MRGPGEPGYLGGVVDNLPEPATAEEADRGDGRDGHELEEEAAQPRSRRMV